MNKLRRCYVAGPYTHGDMLENTNKAIEFGDKLFRAGFAPFVPHLVHHWISDPPHTWWEWMDYCQAWLPTCEFLVRMPGISKGGDIEVETAKRLGIPVYFSAEEAIEKESKRPVKPPELEAQMIKEGEIKPRKCLLSWLWRK